MIREYNALDKMSWMLRQRVSIEGTYVHEALSRRGWGRRARGWRWWSGLNAHALLHETIPVGFILLENFVDTELLLEETRQTFLLAFYIGSMSSRRRKQHTHDGGAYKHRGSNLHC